MKKLALVLTALLIASGLYAQVSGETGNKLKESTGSGVSIITDLDYSKKKPLAIKNITAEEAEFNGDSCLKVSNAKARMLRFVYLFDQPVATDDLAHMKLSIAGFEGYEGFWNIALMYEQMDGAEHQMSCYTGSVLKDSWTDYDFNLTGHEVWGHKFKEGKKIIGIQFYSDQTKSIYIKDLELIKK